MERVLEPEIMDSPHDAADYDAMDHEEVNRAFVADLLATGRIGSPLLDLGTGTARIPIEFCRRTVDFDIVACDMAASMLALARRNIVAAGWEGRISLHLLDAKQLPFGNGSFAAVISNSIVHHIPNPMVVLREAVRVTAPGGRIFFRDLLRPSDEKTWEALVGQYAGDASGHQRELFADSLRAALSLDEIRQLVTSLGFGSETVRFTSDRHWTWSAEKPMMHQERQDRENLLKDAVALVERVEISLHGSGIPIVIGFRRNGCLSIYFGSDPAYHFNSLGQLRRAFVTGKMIKAEKGRLAELRRTRRGGQVELSPTELSAEQQTGFLEDLQQRAKSLAHSLEHGAFHVMGKIPADVDVVGRGRHALKELEKNIDIALGPHAE